MYRKNSADIIRQHVCRSLLCAAMYGEYVTFSTRASFLLSAAPDDEENWTPRRFSDSMLRIIVEAIWKENGLKNVLLLPDRSVQQTRWSQKRYARHTNQLSSISLRLPDLSYMQAIDCTAQFSTQTKSQIRWRCTNFPFPFQRVHRTSETKTGPNNWNLIIGQRYCCSSSRFLLHFFVEQISCCTISGTH